MLPELKAEKGWQSLKAPLSLVEKIELSSKSWANEHVGQVSVKYQPSGRLVAVKNWPGVGRHACRLMSADISTKYRLVYWPTIGHHMGREYRPILSRQMPWVHMIQIMNHILTNLHPIGILWQESYYEFNKHLNNNIQWTPESEYWYILGTKATVT